MNLFGTIYDKIIAWSKHKYAAYWLSFVSFIEAIFFPIPPDVMLIPVYPIMPPYMAFMCRLLQLWVA